jgi:hypothetical protein
MNDPVKPVLVASNAAPSIARMLRTASPTRRAARYIDGTL